MIVQYTHWNIDETSVPWVWMYILASQEVEITELEVRKSSLKERLYIDVKCMFPS